MPFQLHLLLHCTSPACVQPGSCSLCYATFLGVKSQEEALPVRQHAVEQCMNGHMNVMLMAPQELEQELEPKEEQIESLNQQLQEQDGELVEELACASVGFTQPLLLTRVPQNPPIHKLQILNVFHKLQLSHMFYKLYILHILYRLHMSHILQKSHMSHKLKNFSVLRNLHIFHKLHMFCMC